MAVHRPIRLAPRWKREKDKRTKDSSEACESQVRTLENNGIYYKFVLLNLFARIFQDAFRPQGIKHTAGTKPGHICHSLLGRSAALFHPIDHFFSEAG